MIHENLRESLATLREKVAMRYQASLVGQILSAAGENFGKSRGADLEVRLVGQILSAAGENFD